MMKKAYSDTGYEAVIGQLFTRFPSFQSQGASAYKPGLGHSFEICRRMGNPQNAYPCIHVAGTNGKGSTCNMLAAQFAARGLKVGLYTSPHILDFRERMRVVTSSEARLVSREKLWGLLQEYDADFEELDLSFFEITTALAFKFFADEKVDIAVIETGLGGRLDATNIIVPKLSVITNIGFDHMDLLGHTLPQIAREKAGIIKPGVPVVIGESNPETDPVFIRVAASNASPIVFADACEYVDNAHVWTFALRAQPLPILESCPAQASLAVQASPVGPLPLHLSGGGQSPDIHIADIGGIVKQMDLQGCYQQKNVRTVMAAMDVLGLEMDEEALKHAAHICDFHGRWEVLATDPYTICDIGHNEHGLKYNFAQLESLLDSGEYSDLVMVYGSVADKDVDAVLRLLPQRAYVYFTAADNHRAMPAAELFARAGHSKGEAAARVSDAVAAALERCSNLQRPLLYIGGSTYVVSEAVQAMSNSDLA